MIVLKINFHVFFVQGVNKMILGTKLKNPVIWTNYYWFFMYFLHIQEQYNIISTAKICLSMTLLRTSLSLKQAENYILIYLFSTE